MIKNIINKINLIIVSLMIISAINTASAQPGAELVLITVSHANGVETYIPGDNIDLPGGNLKVSLAFKGLKSGEQSFVLNAPFAKDILSSTGTISRIDNLWIMKIYGLRGQSFTIDFVGDLKGSNYIEIIQGGDVPVKVAYIALRGKNEIPIAEPGTNVIVLAEKNMAKIKDMGLDTTLLDLKFENAKLKANNTEAMSMLNGIIQETQTIIDHSHELELRLIDLKNRAIISNRLDEASPLLLNAEKTITENNFEAAERYLNQLEDMLRPSLIREIIPYMNYILYGLFFIGMIILYKRFRTDNKGGGFGL